MLASDIFRLAPLDATIRFSNGAPQPPDRFMRKLRAWEEENGSGTLVEWRTGRDGGLSPLPATFGLHIATYASCGRPVLVVRRIYSIASRLDFEILGRPALGSALVLSRSGEGEELLHAGADTGEASAWLARSGYRDATIAIVSDTAIVPRPLVRRRAA